MSSQVIKRCILLLAFAPTLFVRCDKEESVIDPNNPLLGTWIQIQSEENTVIYMRASRLKDDGYGLIFRADGHLVMRQIAGWCATPPVVYADYEGQWSFSGSTLHTIVRYQWMPEDTKQSGQILSVDDKQLILSYQ